MIGKFKFLLSLVALLSYLFPAFGAPAPNATLISVNQYAEKHVFAHFMVSQVPRIRSSRLAILETNQIHTKVGIVRNYQLDDWKTDMAVAQSIGIDAFALNCASIDSYTYSQLDLAYKAAAEVGFKVFISFDFAYWNNGDTANITAYMQLYGDHPGQMKYKGAAVVSTFVGDYFNWEPVKQGTSHPIYALPNLQDPAEATSLASKGADGAFSWLAWPTDGGNSIIPAPMTTVWDDRFFRFLEGKTYMARKNIWIPTGV